MYSTNILLAVAIAILCIGAIVWFVVKHTKSLIAQEKILFMFIFLTSMLTGVWFVDKVIAIKVELLSPEESKNVFQIITGMISLVVGYYMGAKRSDKN